MTVERRAAEVSRVGSQPHPDEAEGSVGEATTIGG